MDIDVADTGQSRAPVPSLAYAANNFTPLRLLLASLVLCFHYWLLSGGRTFVWPFVYPDFAVDGFFIVSGALVYAAFDRRPEPKEFFIRRILRLYPLYITVVMLQTIVFTAIQPDGVRPHLLEALRYLVVNAVFLNFLQNHIGHVMDHLADPGINPSLWTLKVEVAFYAIVPLIWLGVKRWGIGWLIGVALASVMYTAVLRHFGRIDLSRELPGAMQYFILGILFYRYRRYVRISVPAMTLMGAIAFMAVTFIQMGTGPFTHEFWRILFPVFVGVVVYGFAFVLPPLGLERDFSYGIYLFHGPVLQFFAIQGWLHFSGAVLLIVVATVLPLAVLAEMLIERPCIVLGRKLTAA